MQYDQSDPNEKISTGSEIHAPGKIYHAALYARRRFTDLVQPDEPDLSAAEQIRAMKEYLADLPDISVDGIYTDGRKMRSTTPRPQFQKLLLDIQAGNYNCIVMYSLDTFGRDVNENRYYVLRRFTTLGLRILSLLDGYDSFVSEPRPGTFSRLEELIKLNMRFDKSRKRTATAREYGEKGLVLIKKNVPYGYRVSPDEDAKLVVDQKVVPYIRYIFEQYASGAGPAEIARNLTAMKAPCPTMRKSQLGVQYKKTTPNDYWASGSVSGILRNQIYTGDFVCGKSYIRKCDPFNYRPEIPENEWIVVPDSHPGYITHEEYARINLRLKAVTKRHKQQTQKNALQDEANPNSYKGKLLCPVCGRVMCSSFHAGSSIPDRKYICFNETHNNHGPHYTNIRKTMLDIIVLNQLQEQFQLAKLLSNWLRSPEGKRRADRRVGKCQDALNQASRQFDILKAEQTSLFEHYADNIINGEDYAETMSLLREKLNLAANKLEKSAQDLATLKLALTMENPWLKLFASLPYPDEVTADIVQKTVDKIIVHSKEDVETHFLYQENFTLLWRLYKETDK